MNSIESFDRLYRQAGLQSQRRYPNDSLIAFISSIPQPRNHLRVLEVGCGTGANLWMIAKEGFNAYGIDSSETAVNLAKQELRNTWGVSAEISVASFDKIPYADSYFDVVVDVLSLEHESMAPAEKSIKEIGRLLRDEGLFFSFRLGDKSSIFVNSSDSKIDIRTLANISSPNEPYNNNGPILFSSTEYCEGLFSQANLRISKFETLSRTYENGAFVEYLAIQAKKIVD